MIQVRHRSDAPHSRHPRQVRKEATVTGSCVCSESPVPDLFSRAFPENVARAFLPAKGRQRMKVRSLQPVVSRLLARVLKIESLRYSWLGSRAGLPAPHVRTADAT